MLSLRQNSPALYNSKVRYDWQPDLPDYRDNILLVKAYTLWRMPYAIDLSRQFPPLNSLYPLGNCAVSNLSEAIAQLQAKGQSLPENEFTHYKEQALSRLIDSGASSQLRKGLKDYAKSRILNSALLSAIAAGAKGPQKHKLPEKAFTYYRIRQDLNHLKACLSEGHPFVFGFSVYDGFEKSLSADTGELQMPGPDEYLLGGHTALCIGYNDKTERFLLRNACWSKTGGLPGNLSLPYRYLANPGLAGDFWTLRGA